MLPNVAPNFLFINICLFTLSQSYGRKDTGRKGVRGGGEERKSERKEFPVVGSLFKWLQWPGIDQTDAQSQELHLDLPHG